MAQNQIDFLLERVKELEIQIDNHWQIFNLLANQLLSFANLSALIAEITAEYRQEYISYGKDQFGNYYIGYLNPLTDKLEITKLFNEQALNPFEATEKELEE